VNSGFILVSKTILIPAHIIFCVKRKSQLRVAVGVIVSLVVLIGVVLAQPNDSNNFLQNSVIFNETTPEDDTYINPAPVFLDNGHIALNINKKVSQAVIDAIGEKESIDVLIVLETPHEFVSLSDSSVKKALSRNEKKLAVDAIESIVAKAQADFLEDLYKSDEKGSLTDNVNFKLRRAYSHIGIIHAEVNEAGLVHLQNSPHVKYVALNELKRPMLVESTQLINVNEVWSLEINGTALDGSGQTVCVIDTGIDSDHAAFGSGWGGVIVGGHAYQDKGAVDSECTVLNPSPCEDTNGHGTHCAGTVASRHSTYTGVAPGANLAVIHAYTASAGGLWDDDVIAGINWCLANSSSLNISVISMSIGGGRYYSSCDAQQLAYSGAINTSVNLGISVVIASGNDAYTDSILSPACIENAISIGAVYDYTGTYSSGTCSDNAVVPDRVSCFTNSDVNQLDLMAPGSSITAPFKNGVYTPLSGTSMATPHVAGAFAIIYQYLEYSGKSMAPFEIKELFKGTGAPVTNRAGPWTRIDVLAAIIRLNPLLATKSAAAGTVNIS